MTRKVIIIAALVLAVGAYGIGYFKSSLDSSAAQMSRDMNHWARLAELDRSFLESVATRPSTLTTGTYVLETRFPGSPARRQDLHLVFSNGRFALPVSAKPRRNGMAETLQLNDNVVSWHQEGIMYEGNAEFVGVVDGDKVWGRVYGWNPGDESIGLWRLYRKEEQPKD